MVLLIAFSGIFHCVCVFESIFFFFSPLAKQPRCFWAYSRKFHLKSSTQTESKSNSTVNYFFSTVHRLMNMCEQSVKNAYKVVRAHDFFAVCAHQCLFILFGLVRILWTNCEYFCLPNTNIGRFWGIKYK